MSATNFARNKSLDLQFGGTIFTPPNSFYLGLSSTSISTTGSGCTEPVGNGYTRVAITNDKTKFTVATAGSLLNSTLIAFPTSSGSWGTMTNVALFDNSTSGSIWYYAQLSSPIVIQNLTTLSFAIGAITISET